MGGWAKIFQFFPSEDIDCDEMDLGMTVLASFGSTHFNDFAGATLDYNEAVLPQSRALHRVCGRCAGIGTLEGVLMLWREENQHKLVVPMRLTLGGGEVEKATRKDLSVPAHRRPW